MRNAVDLLRNPRNILILAAVAFLTLIVLAAADSAGVRTPVAVYPSNRDKAASPTTQISFRGARPDALTGIEVEASETGKHEGELGHHSDGLGASFIPDKPFKHGEKVKVTADVDLIDSGGDNTIVFKTYREAPPGTEKVGKVNDPGGSTPFEQRFKTEPTIRPPGIHIRRKDPGVARGHVFLGVKAGKGQDGPMIMDDNGELIWFKQVPFNMSPFDVRAQEYDGRDVLTWWEGKVRKGEGYADAVIYGDNYRFLRRVKAGNGYRMDLHEFIITGRDTALFIAYHPIAADVSRIGGPKNGAALDAIVQEVDIKTGLVLFEWHAIDHMTFKDAFNPYREDKAFDFAHVNSIHEEDNGNLLVSVRNTSTALEIDRATGNTVFRIGGKRPTLPMIPKGFFIAQHAITRTSTGAIAIFDNGAGAPPRHERFEGRPSRGLVLRQPRPPPGVPPGVMPPQPIQVENELRPDEPRRTFSQGSVQELRNRGFFVGWGGDQSWFSEFSPDGQLVYDAQLLPEHLDTYRAYKLIWTGRPDYPPKAFAERTADGTTVYASWNGSTNTRWWQVVGGSDPDDLQPIGDRVRKDGFETAIPVPGDERYYAVQSLGREKRVQSTSRPVEVADQ